MMKLLKFLLTYTLKTSQPKHKASGFTLLELLVALVLAFLIITPLMGFVINMMTSDRQEQAKATSEQEMQAALDYMARDLDQAFFIYDGWGLNQISARLPQVQDAIPGATGDPVLAFWKRQLLKNALPIRGRNAGACNNPNPTDCDDAFIYSLVVYYRIKDSTCNINSPWSCTTRVGRIQLNDELRDVNNPPANGDPAEIRPESPGFRLFDLQTARSSIEDSMNAWANAGAYDYNQTPIETLIDYIDQSPDVPAPDCPTTPRPSPRPDGQPDTADYTNRQVPLPTSNLPNLTSFYACIDTDKTIAQVFIRGNALARIKPKGNPPAYVASQSAYFPKATIQAQGRGLLTQTQTGQ
jgi:type II secretory pathway pseudopilin PulG